MVCTSAIETQFLNICLSNDQFHCEVLCWVILSQKKFHPYVESPQTNMWALISLLTSNPLLACFNLFSSFHVLEIIACLHAAVPHVMF